MTEFPHTKSEQTVFLEKPPCCIEFCPANSNYFIVGTYNLRIDADNADNADTTDVAAVRPSELDAGLGEQQRDGSLVVYLYENDKIETVETHMTPFGVLDMHFSPQNPLLGVTTSTGSIALYEWCTQPGLIKKEYLIHRHTLQLFDTSTVITSLAWDLHMANRVYLSSTTGEISAVTLSSEEIEAGSADLPSRNKFHAPSQRLFYELDTVTRHDLEAWTVVTTPLSWTTQGLFSGGDDASVKFTPFSDARNGTCDTDASDNAASTTPWLNNRIHGAGVVSVLPLMNGILLTGSYDDHLRIISTPSIFGLKAQVLHELNLGGGVWRLKPIPLGTRGSGQDISMTDQFEMRVLISGMYAGAFIVDIKRDVEKSWSSRIVARFTEHESMNYACDVVDSLSLDVQAPRTLVSCSFYDKRLCLWKF